MGDKVTGTDEPGAPGYAAEWLGMPERLLDAVRRDPDSVERQFRSLDATHEFRPHSFMDIEALTPAVVEPQTQRLVFPPTPARPRFCGRSTGSKPKRRCTAGR